MNQGVPHERIAYFSMEVGLNQHIPTYSGGLGILAGDTLKSFADVSMPVVGMTLLNEQGYFHQRIDRDGNQIEEPVEWCVHDHLVQLPNIITVTIEGRTVQVRAWKRLIRGINHHAVPLYFLDTNIEGNSDYDRTLTSHLYGGDRQYRLCQEIILGIGGTRMLESLGYHHLERYHMNEGHAALMTVELLRKTYHDRGRPEDSYDLETVKNKCVFTTHTPVAAGHDRFDEGLFRRLLEDFVPEHIIAKAKNGDKINMTLLGLNLSTYVNGVAKRHGEVTRKMFPHYKINSITNGIHSATWASPAMQRLFDKHIPEWKNDPFTLRYAHCIPKEELYKAHEEAKKELMQYVNEHTNQTYDHRRFTIGFARRFTAYKRPDLLILDIERLKRIAEKVGDIQVIFAGKAHSQDTNGKEIIKHIIQTANRVNEENGKLKIVFLEGYDMQLARRMVSGSDVWLNNPQRPYEASGTSGMKAALNGVPQISTLDGWWLEGHIEGVTGWSLGPHQNNPEFYNDYSPDDEAEDLYRKLEQTIIPLYYNDRDNWTSIMLHAIIINGSFFNTYRMVQQYAASAYNDDNLTATPQEP